MPLSIMRVKDSVEWQGKPRMKGTCHVYVKAIDLKDMLVCVLWSKQVSSVCHLSVVRRDQMCAALHTCLLRMTFVVRQM